MLFITQLYEKKSSILDFRILKKENDAVFAFSWFLQEVIFVIFYIFLGKNHKTHFRQNISTY